MHRKRTRMEINSVVHIQRVIFVTNSVKRNTPLKRQDICTKTIGSSVKKFRLQGNPAYNEQFLSHSSTHCKDPLYSKICLTLTMVRSSGYKETLLTTSSSFHILLHIVRTLSTVKSVLHWRWYQLSITLGEIYFHCNRVLIITELFLDEFTASFTFVHCKGKSIYSGTPIDRQQR